MKIFKSFTFTFLLAVTLALSGCTKNDGDIGLWFGLWHLDSIELNGEPSSDYDSSYYFKFQGNVFSISWINYATHDWDEHYAQWEATSGDKTLTIRFLDSRYAPTFNDYQPKTYLEEITVLDVEALNNEAMVLSRVDEATGVTITYRLTKWD